MMGDQRHEREKGSQAREAAERWVRGKMRGHRTEQFAGWGGRPGSRPGGHAHLVQSHLVDFLWSMALLPRVQFVAQLLRHLLHHVVPQLDAAHFRPRVLIILGELGQVESQALAELMQDPEGVGEGW